MTKERPSFPLKLDSLESKRSQANKSAPLAPIASIKEASTKAQSIANQPSKSPRSAKGVKPLFESASGVGLDSETIREHMVRKLAQQGITDNFVLNAMLRIERHRFVDSALVNQAYEDTSLPIGLGQTISKPNVVARMIELLRQGKNLSTDGKLGRVLEIGTGCGYQAAVLSQLSREVYSIERLKGLFDRAKQNLRPLLIPNLHLLFADGMLGYEKGAPYSGIIAAAGGENIPQFWLDQLALGGRIVAPVETGERTQALLVVDKTEKGFEKTYLEAVHFVPLKSGIN